MVLPAGQAQSFTLTAIGNNTERTVQTELRRTDSAIQAAAGQERFSILYNAQLVGNPFGDPHDDANLDNTQEEYRDALIAAGYKVGRNDDTGYWTISWDVLGPEEVVTVYSARTILAPGTYATQTIDQINLFFDTVSPPVTVKPSVVTINGGDIDESEFGATISVFYEYVVIVTQSDDVDHSTDLKNNLIANIGSYTDANLEVYRLVNRS